MNSATPGPPPERASQFPSPSSTIPSSAAAADVQYIVQGFRGTRAGTPSTAVTIQFGADAPGLTAGVATVRMAA